MARSCRKYVCLAGCCGYPDVDGYLLFAAAASRVVVEIQLWLTWVRVATAIPLFTVDIQFMRMKFDQG